jgi:type III restriction enzyme
MDLQEALYVQRGTLDGETTIIVSTLAALRVEDTDGRKVYETAGALQHHFAGLSPALREVLETEGDGQIIYSLANVLRLRRPVVIMDEAHNARTKLSFDTLTRFNPSTSSSSPQHR